MMKINKEIIQKLNPLFQAIVEGKDIQVASGDGWVDIDLNGEGINAFTLIACPECYRIKPEANYRPFKSVEECWHEMLKHQPFGWVKTDSGYEPIWHVNEGDDFNATFKDSTFADGTPYGIKEEE